jgi:ceramide glucosyltransferase
MISWLDGLGTIVGSIVTWIAIAYAIALAVHLQPRSWSEPLELEPSEFEQLSIVGPPVVTILKPLKGFHHDLAANLTSFLDLATVPYEVLIGIADRQDQNVAIVEEFLRQHPTAPIRLIFTEARSGVNPKMLNLMALEPEIRGEIILVSDGSTRANPHSLQALVVTFQNPQVGWACAPYFVRQPQTLGAKLRSLFMGSQLTAIKCGTYRLTGIAPTMGTWQAYRKQALVQIGGFARFSHCLAADGASYPILGALGWKGAIVPDLIDVYLGDWTVQQAWAQAVRWGRLFRTFAITGPLILLLFNGTFWGLLALLWLSVGAKIGATGLAIAGLTSWLCNSINYLRLGGSGQDLLLLGLSDLKLMLVVVWSYLGNKISWRGQTFRIGQQGQIQPNAMDNLPERPSP